MTKKQRLEIYKKMLKWFEDGYNQYSYPGFCVAISRLTGEEHVCLKRYPELMKYKPKKLYSFYYWFGTAEKGINKRKQILRKIIKEMS